MPIDTRSNGAVGAHRVATIALVVLGVLKAAVINERTPIWDFDPWRQVTPMTGFGPATGVGLDLAIVILAAFALVFASARGHALRTGWIALGCLGGAAVLAHAWLAGPTWLEVFAPEGGGSAWLAAMAAMLACAHASRDRLLHRIVIGLALGFVGLLLTKGLVQVFVEHPQTVRAFGIDRAQILDARGWSEGSAAARGFERRLMQAEATGWFGLSNVYASFMAASLVGFGGAAIVWAVRTRSAFKDRAWHACVLGAGCGAVGLWLSGSKGGLGAAVVAGAGVALVRIVRRPGLRWWIGPALIVVVLTGVAVRGAIGPAMGELSVLFRSFYAEAALRIFASHPLLGVGPGGFQDAYLIAKPPISPEAVTSPHSILFDWLAMLGTAGLAWAGVFVAAAQGMGRGLGATRDSRARPPVSWRALVLIAGVVVFAGAFAERYATTVEIAGARVVGLAVWVGLAAALINGVPLFALRFSASAAGLVFVAHMQIEMTGVQPESAVLCLILLGLGVVPGGHRAGARRMRTVGVTLATCSAGLAAVPLSMGVLQLTRWQGHLLTAADHVAPMAEAARLGRPVPPPGAAMLVAAEEELAAAVATRPGHEPSVKALGRTAGVRASADVRTAMSRGAGAGGLEVAVASARAFVALADTASAHSWLGLVALSAAESGSFGADEADSLRTEGERALLRAATLDPFGVSPALRLADFYRTTGPPDEAAAWARETLGRDNLTALDPLMGLTEEQRRRIEAQAGAD